MMNPEVKAQWLTALRSGEYTQGRNALNRHGKFCCLGVLCDLAVKSGLELKVESSEFGDGIAYDDDPSLLPKSIQRWSGLNTEGPEIHFVNEEGDDATEELATLNDNGETFSSIADLIEAQL